MTTQLEDAVTVLASARSSHAAAKRILADERARFETEHADLIDMAAMAAADETQAERTVRALALSEFEATGIKAPCQGVSIVLTKALSYDKAEATKWALTAMPDLVIPAQVDVKAFDKIARTAPLPFVTITETPSVRIATALEG